MAGRDLILKVTSGQHCCCLHDVMVVYVTLQVFPEEKELLLKAKTELKSLRNVYHVSLSLSPGFLTYVCSTGTDLRLVLQWSLHCPELAFVVSCNDAVL